MTEDQLHTSAILISELERAIQENNIELVKDCLNCLQEVLGVRRVPPSSAYLSLLAQIGLTEKQVQTMEADLDAAFNARANLRELIAGAIVPRPKIVSTKKAETEHTSELDQVI